MDFIEDVPFPVVGQVVPKVVLFNVVFQVLPQGLVLPLGLYRFSKSDGFEKRGIPYRDQRKYNDLAFSKAILASVFSKFYS